MCTRCGGQGAACWAPGSLAQPRKKHLSHTNTGFPFFLLPISRASPGKTGFSGALHSRKFLSSPVSQGLGTNTSHDSPDRPVSWMARPAAQTRVCTHTCAHVHTHTRVLSHIQGDKEADPSRQTHLHTHAHEPTPMHPHTCTHMCTHTHTQSGGWRMAAPPPLHSRTWLKEAPWESSSPLTGALICHFNSGLFRSAE